MLRQNLLFACLAHAVASSVVVALTLVLAFVGYFGALAWAVVVGWPIGGMLALPGLLVLALMASVAASIFVFFPVTVAASVLCRWVFKWPRAAEIPVAAGLCLLEVFLVVLLGSARQPLGIGSFLWACALLTLTLLGPLGLYWWTLQASDGVRTLFLKVRDAITIAVARVGDVPNTEYDVRSTEAEDATHPQLKVDG